MLFNSLEFAIFLPIVFFLYWFVSHRSLKLQNLLLLFCSYVFYGWWDWRFLSLIFLSSLVDYSVGFYLEKTKDDRNRKLLLFLSILTNLGLLGFFKYYNFFTESFISAFSSLGISLNASSLNIILPVGISFYTFQTLSYTIDIFRKKISPTKDVIAFFAFVSFFPQLVAGPIERAKSLLPQFEKKRTFDLENAKDGLRQILWGLFKKIVIADTCAGQVDYIFSNSDTLSGSYLLLGAVYFAFQIYCDFSGYSDIAIGTARLFGFKLMRNFAFPYFSRDPAEFWRRWHISLSTWFRDYVYIPLGGSYGSKISRIRNIIITFTISGFWHGANWTFLAWGFLNGLYYIPLMLLNKQKVHSETVAQGRLLPSLIEFLQVCVTFFITLIAWVFFRADSIGHAFAYISSIFSTSLFSYPVHELDALFWIMIVVVIEWLQRDKQHALQISRLPLVFRWLSYYVIALLVLKYFGEEQTFIYFQF